jgi:hypothetical protein
MLLESDYVVLLVSLFIINVLGVIFFCRIMLSLMYGSIDESTAQMDIVDINVKERAIIDCLVFAILTLSFLIYIV